MGWAIFWAISSQTHRVTLVHEQERKSNCLFCYSNKRRLRNKFEAFKYTHFQNMWQRSFFFLEKSEEVKL
jgi:hypothetical protein